MMASWMTPDQFARLPMYAQKYIEHLKDNLASANAAAETFLKAQETSRVYLEDHTRGGGPADPARKYIPDNRYVVFALGDDEERQDVEVRIKPKGTTGERVLEITSHTTHDREMVTRPGCSNQFEVLFVPGRFPQ